MMMMRPYECDDDDDESLQINTENKGCPTNIFRISGRTDNGINSQNKHYNIDRKDEGT
jgi:hypothetical protein